jgi:hypothetical protein
VRKERQRDSLFRENGEASENSPMIRACPVTGKVPTTRDDRNATDNEEFLLVKIVWYICRSKTTERSVERQAA